MPIKDYATKKQYVRGYHRALTRLRKRHSTEFAHLLYLEREQISLQEADEIHNPGPRKGKKGSPYEFVGVEKKFLEEVGGRIRHDHAYPMEISDNHHCKGCEIETIIKVLLKDADDIRNR
jgi:hypothetical protein